MLLITLALFLASFMTSSPQRWVHIGGKPNLYEEYLDKESVWRSGAKVTLWTRRDSMTGREIVWNEFELDCSARTAAILAYVRDDGGTVSHNAVRPHREASPIHPQSIEERIFAIACRD